MYASLLDPDQTEPAPPAIQIFATDKKTGKREEITNLYWFEEEGVYGFDGEGHHAEYTFEVFVLGKRVY